MTSRKMIKVNDAPPKGSWTAGLTIPVLVYISPAQSDKLKTDGTDLTDLVQWWYKEEEEFNEGWANQFKD